MKRREFISLVGGIAAAWPSATRAQQRGVPVVGFLRGGTAAGAANLVSAFRKGLSETGFVEGRNLSIEFRWGLDSPELRAEAAAEMVGRKVDVIIRGCVGGQSADHDNPDCLHHIRRSGPDRTGAKPQPARRQCDWLHRYEQRNYSKTIWAPARTPAPRQTLRHTHHTELSLSRSHEHRRAVRRCGFRGTRRNHSHWHRS